MEPELVIYRFARERQKEAECRVEVADVERFNQQDMTDGSFGQTVGWLQYRTELVFPGAFPAFSHRDKVFPIP